MNFGKDLLESIPKTTGVYILKDKKGKSIYIGKAKNLRARVNSYFQQGEDDLRPQISYLMDEIWDIDYLVTRNEREALILENSLIKQKKPKYNIRLKDDKNYTSLRLDLSETFPKLTYTRRIKKDGAVYFGPFASAKAMRYTKRLIHKIFKLRDCSEEKFKRHSERPCLNYYMKQCSGPCAGMIDETAYKEAVEQTKMFLRGDKNRILEMLSENMDKASEDLRFEDAAYYRDQIKLLEKHLDSNMVVTRGTKDSDIIGLYKGDKRVEVVVLFSRGKTVIDKADFTINNTSLDDRDLLREFIGQFYGDQRYVPNEILVPESFEDIDLFSDWLSEKQERKVKIKVPQRGPKRKLLKVAKENARVSFNRKSTERAENRDLLKQVKSALRLKTIPQKIECFDISNIQGDVAVGSMVRFENGKADKSMYKRFKIKSVSGANDYAMMYEVLVRRINRAEQEGWELPELMLIDGGKGQLNIAVNVLEELGIKDDVELASIAKARKEVETDKIYIPGRSNPISLHGNSRVLYYLMEIRDEAHRFAISYHQKLRKKTTLKSRLDTIPGIGNKRKKKLLNRFGSVSKIKEASLSELASVSGISDKIASKLKKNLSSG